MSIKARGGQIFNLALTPGQTITQPAFGTRAYLVIATAAVNMRVRGKEYGAGAYAEYAQGTGIGEVDQWNQFDVVDVQNFNSFPVVVSLWVGFADFIDNRLILTQSTIPSITYPTQSTSGATNIAIPDLSGGPFFDLQGNKWLALYRIAIIISNLDPSTPLLLQEFGSVVANGPAVLNIPPTTDIQHPSAGNFTINIGGGAINAIVCELYAAIPAT